MGSLTTFIELMALTNLDLILTLGPWDKDVEKTWKWFYFDKTTPFTNARDYCGITTRLSIFDKAKINYDTTELFQQLYERYQLNYCRLPMLRNTREYPPSWQPTFSLKNFTEEDSLKLPTPSTEYIYEAA
jgi:hypothetical protein